jgi:hypothetical protein
MIAAESLPYGGRDEQRWNGQRQHDSVHAYEQEERSDRSFEEALRIADARLFRRDPELGIEEGGNEPVDHEERRIKPREVLPPHEASELGERDRQARGDGSNREAT